MKVYIQEAFWVGTKIYHSHKLSIFNVLKEYPNTNLFVVCKVVFCRHGVICTQKTQRPSVLKSSMWFTQCKSIVWSILFGSLWLDRWYGYTYTIQKTLCTKYVISFFLPVYKDAIPFLITYFNSIRFVFFYCIQFFGTRFIFIIVLSEQLNC